MIAKAILTGILAIVVSSAFIGCSQSTEIEEENVPPNWLEEQFTPVVLSYRGRNHLLPGQTIENEGFEFVLGAEREYLEQVDTVTVYFPDGKTTRTLFPSTDLGVPLDFFGYYGSSEGLPPAGDYVFRIAMKDRTQIEVVDSFSGKVLSLPENVTANIDKKAGIITVIWDPVEGVRNYTVDLQKINPDDRSYNFVEGVGCPDSDTADPGHWTETQCIFPDLHSYLGEGNEYGIQIAVWSDFSYGGIDGAVLFTW